MDFPAGYPVTLAEVTAYYQDLAAESAENAMAFLSYGLIRKAAHWQHVAYRNAQLAMEHLDRLLTA